MNILVIGGTLMIGRSFVENLLANYSDYNVTLANRGLSNPKLFDLKFIKIDRNNNCSVLNEHFYDLAIDFSCYNVEHFKNVYHHVRSKFYLYISTVCVDYEHLINNEDQDNALSVYCKKKKKVEEYIAELNDPKIVIYRPLTVYGDYDYTRRFKKIGNKYYHGSHCASDDKKHYISQESLTIELSKIMEQLWTSTPKVLRQN